MASTMGDTNSVRFSASLAIAHICSAPHMGHHFHHLARQSILQRLSQRQKACYAQEATAVRHALRMLAEVLQLCVCGNKSAL